MTKIFTHTQEIEHCGECPDVDDHPCSQWGKQGSGNEWWCWRFKGDSGNIKDVWGEIPKFCPLEEKSE